MNRLEDRGLVEFGDAEEGIQLVGRALEKHFTELDLIEQEARQRLARNQTRPPKPEEIEAEMQKIAAERGLVL